MGNEDVIKGRIRAAEDCDFSLGLFSAWLQRRGVKTRTADCYTSALRGFLYERGGPVFLAGHVIEYDAKLERSARSQFRTSMRAFLEFAREKGADLIPINVSFPDHRRRSAGSSIYKPLVAPLKALFASEPRLRPTDVERLKWGDGSAFNIDPTGKTIRLQKGDDYWIVARAPLQDLAPWVANNIGAPHLMQPLIPSEPGGMYPMPARKLAKIAELEFASRPPTKPDAA